MELNIESKTLAGIFGITEERAGEINQELYEKEPNTIADAFKVVQDFCKTEGELSFGIFAIGIAIGKMG